MGFFKNLFGGGASSAEQDMAQLLGGPSSEMASEMERIYRNHVLNIAEASSGNIELSARGILKARLFGSTFMLFIFMMKWQNNGSATDQMMTATTGVAFEPFSDTTYQPNIDRNEAISFADDYLKKVFQAIALEQRDGPSSPSNQTDGFRVLIELYEEALKESVSIYSINLKENFSDSIKGTIFSNLRNMSEWNKAL